MGNATSMKKINGDSLKESSMIINDSTKTCGKVRISTAVADSRAERLVQKFNAPQCRLFFLKCIYHLPEYEIEQAVETAMRPGINSHIRYFTVVAKQKLAQAGY